MARRRKTVPLAPWQVRTKLHPQQVHDLQTAHTVNLDDMASGRASPEVMWQIIGGVLTWLRVAEKLQRGIGQMQAQHELMVAVLARYVRTGQVGFIGNEYETARQGVLAMDTLAELVDRPTALAAVAWAEIRCKALQRVNARAEATAP